MIKLNGFLIAEYASLSADARLVIAGTFDNLDVQRRPGAPEGALQQIPFPRATLAIVTEASLADGLSHTFRLRIIDGNGQPIADDIPLEVAYALNPFGRPLRNNLLVNIQNLMLPGPDDYTFALYVGDQSTPLGELSFSVTERVEPT